MRMPSLDDSVRRAQGAHDQGHSHHESPVSHHTTAARAMCRNVLVSSLFGKARKVQGIIPELRLRVWVGETSQHRRAGLRTHRLRTVRCGGLVNLFVRVDVDNGEGFEIARKTSACIRWFIVTMLSNSHQIFRTNKRKQIGRSNPRGTHCDHQEYRHSFGK